MRLRVHADAREELIAILVRYEAEVPGLGSRFLAEIERCLQLLAATPLVGPSHERRLRRVVIGGSFPFCIIYSVRGQELIVIAFAHEARRPGYWKRRTRS